ncbi:MAG TPA: T9SS type A sorting domain-containing protein, partial [Candidatus Kapabacteria bacterium]|jgi:hypothetical protein
MNGEGNLINFIGSATPDPVSSGNVTIKYQNNVSMNLTLSIYDQLGNEVMRPIDNIPHGAGAWQVACDVSKFASGTYTYRLSGSNIVKGQMVTSGQFVVQR